MQFEYRLIWGGPGIQTFCGNGIELDREVAWLLERGAELSQIEVEVIVARNKAVR